MKKALSLLGLALLLMNCKTNAVEKPDDLLTENQMVDILYDLNVVNAMNSTNHQYLSDRGISASSYVYAKYKIDSLQFVNSDHYYASDLEEYEKIYQQVSERLQQNKAEIDSLKSDISKKEKEVNDLYSVYITEAEGTAGTKKLGKGPVYGEKREKHDASLQELATLKTTNQAKITDLEAKAKTLQTDLDKKVTETQPIIDGFDGLMARINALNKLPWLPSFFIMLLFLAIETSPIIAKLLSPKGEFDFKLEDAEMGIKNLILQNRYQSELQRTTDAAIYDKVYAEIRDDRELHNYKKKGATELLKLQSDGFVERQKKSM